MPKQPKVTNNVPSPAGYQPMNTGGKGTGPNDRICDEAWVARGSGPDRSGHTYDATANFQRGTD